MPHQTPSDQSLRDRLSALAVSWESMAARPNGIYGQCAREVRQALAAAPMTEQMADQETDPVRSWMLRYPGDNTIGPGWGAAEAVEDGLACPWCHGSLADHNAAMRAQAQAHTLAALQRAATDPVKPLSRFGVMLPKPEDPWAYPVPWEVLHAGLRAIAATAVARDDYATAAYAFSVLAGEPLPAPTDDEEPTREESVAEARLRRAQEALVATGYFNADEVGPDIAPRITELHAALRPAPEETGRG